LSFKCASFDNACGIAGRISSLQCASNLKHFPRQTFHLACDDQFHLNKNYYKIQISRRTSSKLKSTPPIGAPNATPTPAADAAESICTKTSNFPQYDEFRHSSVQSLLRQSESKNDDLLTQCFLATSMLDFLNFITFQITF